MWHLIGLIASNDIVPFHCRCSTAKAFLRPIRNRPNLHISMNSQVLKLLIDNKSKAVFGVRLKKEDSVYTVLARKEVILSAGTLNSAQLLMLSGQSMGNQ